jgi:molecular chaperone GrpE
MKNADNETPENNSDESPKTIPFETDATTAAAPAPNPTDATEPTLESLTAELAGAEKRVLLAHADLENFRRRMRRDADEQVRYASLGLISELLEAVDNLNRALEADEKDPSSTSDTLAEGVKLVSQQIAGTLNNHGAKKIEAVGQPFDPNLHQAITMQPSEEHAPNTVMMDLRSGFQLHDRVIRPSQVIVAQ